MKKIVKNTLLSVILVLSMTNIGHAFDLDATVDDEIRKNYNPNKLIEDVGLKNNALNKNIIYDSPKIDPNLPDLPNLTNGNSTQKTQIKQANSLINYPILANGNVKIRKGTSFNVISNNTISDWQVKGTKITFKTQKAKHGKGYSIPPQTIFNGEIIEVHQPQISGNGGLVVIRIYSMIYKE